MKGLNPSWLLPFVHRVQYLQLVGNAEYSEYPVNPNRQRENCKLSKFAEFQDG